MLVYTTLAVRYFMPAFILPYSSGCIAWFANIMPKLPFFFLVSLIFASTRMATVNADSDDIDTLWDIVKEEAERHVLRIAKGLSQDKEFCVERSMATQFEANPSIINLEHNVRKLAEGVSRDCRTDMDIAEEIVEEEIDEYMERIEKSGLSSNTLICIEKTIASNAQSAKGDTGKIAHVAMKTCLKENAINES